MPALPGRLLLLAALAAPAMAVAQNATQQPVVTQAVVTQPAAPHSITPADISAWKTIRGATLSLDGAWFAYTVTPNEGDSWIMFRETRAGGRELRFDVGEIAGGGNLQLSADGKWGAYLEYPTAAEQKRMRTARRPVQAKAVIVELATGTRRDFEHVRRVQFSGDSPRWLAMQGYAPEGAGAGAAAGRAGGTDLLLYELATGTLTNVGNVSEFAFDRSGRWLGYVIDAREQFGNGVQLRDLNTGVTFSIDAGKALYRRFAWTDTLAAFGFLKGTVDSAGTDTLWTAMGVTGIGLPTRKLSAVGFNADVALPDGMEVSPDRTPRWTERMDAMIIGLRVATSPLPKSEELESDERPTLRLWHTKDPRLQSMQQVQENADKSFSFIASFTPASGKVVQLTDDGVRSGVLAAGDQWLLGYDNREYERQANLDGIQRRDAYIINTRTGEKKLVRKDLRSTAQVSPDGRYALYWDDGNYHVYNIATGAVTNITRSAPVSFINTEDDHNIDRPPTSVFGWASDGKSVLISDNWDIWKIPVTGTGHVNLTGDGRAKMIRYRRAITIDPRVRGVDLSKPFYTVGMQERTKKEAFVRVDPARPGAVVQGDWKDARITPMRARDAEVWISTIQTFARFPDYWRVTWGGDSVRLSDVNPGMNGVAWSPGSRLVTYVSDKGDTLQGALYLPAGYEEGKKYPTVVFIYEHLSDQLHQFSNPTFTSSYTPGLHTSRGYAVFQPDINYVINDPGMSAVWSVVPAVKAAIRTGIVDSAKVGLHGHSWGGYQTAFLVGQTDIFTAAVAGAPLTDMISMYSSVYWNSGSANQPIFQSSQGRFKGNFIENMEAYERNSPNRFADKVNTPLVILHDDKDGAVDFNQGITFYNTLRQLNKDVILLEYVGENHGLSQLKNRKDYILRLQDWWDHYLKGDPPKEWLENGIPHLKMDEHLREMKKRLAPPVKTSM